MYTKHGGGAPAGFGAHPLEEHLWEEPVYRTHPLYGRKEATNQGLFFRFWPEHVSKLIRMKDEGWAHVEIVRTAKKFWERQCKEYQKIDSLITEHKDAQQQQYTDEIQQLRHGELGDWMEQEPQEEASIPGLEMEKSGKNNPLFSEDDYLRELEQFRGRSYSRDVSFGMGGGHSGSFERSQRRVKPSDRNGINKVRSVLEHPSFSKGVAGKKGHPFSLPPLPFKYDAFEPVFSEETMRFHHKILHKKYVDQLNKLVKDTRYETDTVYEILHRVNERLGETGLAQDLRQQAGGYLNHNLFWENITPGGSNPKKDGDFHKEVNKEFGSISKLEKEIKEKCLKRVGSGWVWLAISEDEGLIVYSTLNQDSPVMWGDIPILAIDLWEHSYFLDFGPDKKGYVEELLKNVNWEEVENRYEVAMSMKDEDKPSKGKNGGFGIILKKSPEGGEVTLMPEQARRKKEMSFTRKDMGVANAPFTPPPEKENPHKDKSPETGSSLP